MTAARPEALAPYAIFAATLAAAGLPIYIHAPKFFVDEYGVSLASLSGVLSPCACWMWYRTLCWAVWQKGFARVATRRSRLRAG